MKEYNVILKRGVDYDSFWNDIESDTDGGKLYIPNRAVQFTNERPASLRQCWYLLTDEEAELLKGDDRVLGVEIPPEHRDDVQIGLNRVQRGRFEKTTSDTGEFLNWGLFRTNYDSNIFGTGILNSGPYLYVLDGSGVDIVIQDSGIQIDHPEFQDEFGVTRFVSVDWGSYGSDTTGSFTQSPNHDRDYDGHGTHVAGIAAGKTYGWAKNARIHHQKLSGLEGTNDTGSYGIGTGILPTHAFDSIKLWHNAKSTDPNTGYKRPTIVNMSWGYLSTYTTVSSITYRGTTVSTGSLTGSNQTAKNHRSEVYGLPEAYFIFQSVLASNVRFVSVDTDIEELLDAGVHICVAAGNRSHKIDEPNGSDFDNSASVSGGNTSTIYYHRGSSPYGDAGQDGSPRAIIVGNIDSFVFDADNDQKASSSETGPGVDIYAPGTDIMSCTSTTNKWGAASQNYYLNSSYRQTNESGTSMASPQVAGVLALYLQFNPNTTPAQAKEWLLKNATSAINDNGVDNDWTNFRNLKSGDVKMLYNPFGKETPAQIGNLSFNGVNLEFRK